MRSAEDQAAAATGPSRTALPSRRRERDGSRAKRACVLQYPRAPSPHPDPSIVLAGVRSRTGPCSTCFPIRARRLGADRQSRRVLAAAGYQQSGVQFAGEALGDRLSRVIQQFPDALLVLTPAGLLESSSAVPVAERMLVVMDLVGGAMALDGVGAAKPGRAAVAVGWGLAELGHQVGRRIGGKFLEELRFALLKDLGGRLALVNLQRVLAAPVEVGRLGFFQLCEFVADVNEASADVGHGLPVLANGLLRGRPGALGAPARRPTRFVTGGLSRLRATCSSRW